MVRKLKFGSLLSKKQFRWSFDDSTNHDGILLSVKHRLNCSTTSCLIMHKNEEFQTQRTWESLKRNVIDLRHFLKIRENSLNNNTYYGRCKTLYFLYSCIFHFPNSDWIFPRSNQTVEHTLDGFILTEA